MSVRHHASSLRASEGNEAMGGHESNIKLANLWIALEEVRNKIDNEVIPLVMHLGLEDPELMEALEVLSERVGKHFGRWRLVAEPLKGGIPGK